MVLNINYVCLVWMNSKCWSCWRGKTVWFAYFCFCIWVWFWILFLTNCLCILNNDSVECDLIFYFVCYCFESLVLLLLLHIMKYYIVISYCFFDLFFHIIMITFGMFCMSVTLWLCVFVFLCFCVSCCILFLLACLLACLITFLHLTFRVLIDCIIDYMFERLNVSFLASYMLILFTNCYFWIFFTFI